MKKFLTLFLCLIIIFTLSACGKSIKPGNKYAADLSSGRYEMTFNKTTVTMQLTDHNGKIIQNNEYLYNYNKSKKHGAFTINGQTSPFTMDSDGNIKFGNLTFLKQEK